MKKIAIILVIAALAAAGIAVWMLSGGGTADDQVPLSAGLSPEGEDTEPATEQEAETSSAIVRYDGSAFSPAEIRVSAGTTVTFTNQSSRPMWVASDPHPTHTALADFDSRRGIGQNESYNFTFTQVGSWGYHNHLNSFNTGRVVVE